MPSRQDVIDILNAVLKGTMSREAASDWSAKWVAAEDSLEIDPTTWDALNFIFMMDAPKPDRTYAFSLEAIRLELSKLTRGDA